MPISEGVKIIRVILPTGEEITAYYDSSTSPGAWRNNDDDSPVTAWRDGESVRVWMMGGTHTTAYWDAATEAMWTGQDDNPVDRMLSEAELDAVDYVDLRKEGVN